MFDAWRRIPTLTSPGTNGVVDDVLANVLRFIRQYCFTIAGPSSVYVIFASSTRDRDVLWLFLRKWGVERRSDAAENLQSGLPPCNSRPCSGRGGY